MTRSHQKNLKHVKRALRFSVSGALLLGGLAVSGCANSQKPVNTVAPEQSEGEPSAEPTSNPEETGPPARKIINTRPPEPPPSEPSDAQPEEEAQEPTPDPPTPEN